MRVSRTTGAAPLARGSTRPMQAAPDPIAVCDEKGRLVYMNPDNTVSHAANAIPLQVA